MILRRGGGRGSCEGVAWKRGRQLSTVTAKKACPLLEAKGRTYGKGGKKLNEGGTQMDTTARQSPSAEKTPKRRCLHKSRFV